MIFANFGRFEGVARGSKIESDDSFFIGIYYTTREKGELGQGRWRTGGCSEKGRSASMRVAIAGGGL